MSSRQYFVMSLKECNFELKICKHGDNPLLTPLYNDKLVIFPLLAYK